MNAFQFGLLAFFLATNTMCSSHEKPGPTPELGSLEGRLTIGPLRPGPVRMDQREPEVPPELFAAHRIVILAADGATRLQELVIDSKGNYRAELAAGSYWIDFTPRDLGFPESNPPKQLTIERGKTTRIDIDIDTGMR